MRREDLKQKIWEICEEALRRAIPSEEERKKTLRFTDDLAKRLRSELEKTRLEADVQVEGSIAKDTWLAGEKDIDLFILLPRTRGREGFAEVLEVAKKVAGESYLEAYAEHPYIQAQIEDFTVEFVPCFSVQRAEEVASSVDRTPLHTLYVKKRLNPEARNQVRLLKAFMRGIGTYGAEIKVGGFSGYLCEVLTLHHGCFLELLKAASGWREREVIDIEGYYEGMEEEARKIFQEPIIVVDPVDKGRNVASAVRMERLSEFVAASREFLKKPELEFFHPSEIAVFSANELAEMMRSRRSAFVFLKTEAPRAVPDVLWGQLYKSRKALSNLIRRHGFTLVRDGVWSDEKNATIFLFELHSRSLPTAEKHLGPPVGKREDCERFLERHLGSEGVLSGPRIEGNRWVVERKRRCTDVVELLRDKLGDGGEDTGVASLVSQALSDSLTIWVNDEVKAFYSRHLDFASFLTEHLRGKPRWLS